jgi:hypothetical protein
MVFCRLLCAAFTVPALSFHSHLVGKVSMLLSSLALPLPLDTAMAFLAGGAAGILMTLVTKSHRADPILSLIEGDREDLVASSDSIDDSLRSSDVAVFERAAPAPRMRTGRLPLPTCVTALTPADEPALALVNVFADRLAALPYDEWLDVGRREMANAASAAHRATAFAILEATISTQGLGIAAWYARDVIETAAFMATNGEPRRRTDERRAMAVAHAAAEDAALALLARDALAPTDFAPLFAPFEHVLSGDEATRLAASRGVEG